MLACKYERIFTLISLFLISSLFFSGTVLSGDPIMETDDASIVAVLYKYGYSGILKLFGDEYKNLRGSDISEKILLNKGQVSFSILQEGRKIHLIKDGKIEKYYFLADNVNGNGNAVFMLEKGEHIPVLVDSEQYDIPEFSVSNKFLVYPVMGQMTMFNIVHLRVKASPMTLMLMEEATEFSLEVNKLETKFCYEKISANKECVTVWPINLETEDSEIKLSENVTLMIQRETEDTGMAGKVNKVRKICEKIGTLEECERGIKWLEGKLFECENWKAKKEENPEYVDKNLERICPAFLWAF